MRGANQGGGTWRALFSPTFGLVLVPGAAPLLGGYKVVARLNGNSTIQGCPAFISVSNTNVTNKGGIACDSATGSWTDATLDSGTWTLTQDPLSNNSLSGSFSSKFPSLSGTLTCQGTWGLSTDGTSKMDPSTGTFTVIAYPQQTSDPVNCPQSTSITETGTISSAACDTASGKVTVTDNYRGPSSGTFTWAAPATVPGGEQSTFQSWSTAIGLDTLAQFSAVLTSNAGLNFGGRDVIESAGSGAATDTCNFVDAELPFQASNTLSGGDWYVQSDNSYGNDFIGLGPETVGYFQQYGPAHWGGGRTSCVLSVTQQMQISTNNQPGPPSLNYQNYGAPNQLTKTIDSTGITCTRGNATATQPYAFLPTN